MGITDKVIHTPELWNTPRPRVSRQTMNTGYIRRIARNAWAWCCVECEITTEFIVDHIDSWDFTLGEVFWPYEGWYLVSLQFAFTQWGEDFVVNLVASVNEDAGTITLVSPQVAFFQTWVLPTVTNITTNQSRVITSGLFSPGWSWDQENTFNICWIFAPIGTLILDCKDNPPAVVYTITIIDSPDTASIWASENKTLPTSLVITPFGHYEIQLSAPGYVTQTFTIEFTSNGQTEEVCLDPI